MDHESRRDRMRALSPEVAARGSRFQAAQRMKNLSLEVVVRGSQV